MRRGTREIFNNAQYTVVNYVATTAYTNIVSHNQGQREPWTPNPNQEPDISMGKSDVQARVCHTPSEYTQTQYTYKVESRQPVPGIVRLTQSTIQSYPSMDWKAISDGKSGDGWLGSCGIKKCHMEY